MPKTLDAFTKQGNNSIIRKKDLIKSSNLKKEFLEINQHLYGKLKHTETDTRARSKEIINLILCKLVDEKNNSTPNSVMAFSIRNDEESHELLARLKLFFKDNLKNKYKDIIDENENINLNKELVVLVVEKLQNISLLNSSKDVLAEAFEIFVSRLLKETGGQFFTPASVVKFMVNYLDPEIDNRIIDPACGHGGFLLECRDLLLSKIKQKFTNQKELIESKHAEIISNLYGIDKDSYLAKICKLYIDIISQGKSNIFCEDSLDPNHYRKQTSDFIKNNHFEFVFTNPPFGAKIPIDNKEILEKFDLAHKWDYIDDQWIKQDKLVKKQPPQILFIERCVQLLNDGGKLGIVLPEGLFGNPSNRYIWEYLRRNGIILGIISLDQNAFQPYTCNKTSILFFQKSKFVPKDYLIDFAIVDNVGHDKDGKVQYKLNKDGSIKYDLDNEPIINDDLLNLHLKINEGTEFSYLEEQDVFKLNINQIKNNIFIPSYYTGVEKPLRSLEKNQGYILLSIADLIEKSIIYTKNKGYLPRGDEIGSQVYGLGDIPFIRTSEINNWEIHLDSHKKTSEEVYNQFKEKQNLEIGDILLVKDGGPNLIGKTSYITELDTKIIIQSHIYQIKTLKNNENIDPYLLLYLLNLDIVQKQIRAITFVQGTISTIGNRIMDVILPIPSELNKRKEISKHIKDIIESKTEIRKKILNLSINFFDD
ncbi:MAG: N-6 DNA methylase [Candidatus Lokiarchaeota archaeon]|nr:N-6 DNA methylase [Candidatus Lokiarchaeota archaeon]